VLALLAAGVCLTGFVLPTAVSAGTFAVAGNFTWGTGNRDCISPPADYVVCVFASRDVAGIGSFEYARYAENADGFTADGCAKLSTHGTIWVPGGTAEFVGPPADTCGKGTGLGKPDAHYIFTIRKGTGVLAGATGHGDIVADHGVDIWHGSITAPALKGMTVPLPASASASPSAAADVSTPAPTAAIADAVSADRRPSSGSSAGWIAAGGVAAVLLVLVVLQVSRLHRRRTPS
jgi:hypothetical protein